MKHPKQTLRLIFNHAHVLKPRLEEAIRRADDDMQGGFPSRNGDMNGGKTNEINDITSRIALGTPDEIEHRRDMLTYHLREAEKHMSRAITDMVALLGLSHEEAQRIVETQAQKATTCANCRTVVTGTRNDRLKGQRCQKCYDYHRNNKTERPVEVERGAKKLFGVIKPNMANNTSELVER